MGLHPTQNVRFRQREMTVAQYFATYPGVAMTLRIRGGQAVKVVLGSARLYVSAHQQKRLVVALQYPGEEEYRYLVASDLSWRAVDIASAYTLRWLIEIYQSCNLRKTLAMLKRWMKAVAKCGGHVAEPVVVRARRHRPESTTKDVRNWCPALP